MISYRVYTGNKHTGTILTVDIEEFICRYFEGISYSIDIENKFVYIDTTFSDAWQRYTSIKGGV